jgi:hypothetical protein
VTAVAIARVLASGCLALTAPGLEGCTLREEGTGPLGTGAAGASVGAGGNDAASSAGTGGSGAGTWTWTAVEPTDVAAGYELPPWLVFKSPSDARTTQTGTHQIVLGFAPDVPRPRHTGTGWGLALEAERTNVVTPSDSWGDGGWQQGTMTRTPGAPDPAGTTAAARFQSDGTDYSHFYPISDITPSTGSTWARGEGAADIYSRFMAYGPAGVSAVTPIDTADWTRLDWTSDSIERIWFSSAATGPYEPIGSATAFFAFGAQVEAPAKYPSSYIVSGATAATRLAESLSASSADVAPQGWFDVTVTVAPHYASGESLAEHDFLHFDSDNRLYTRPDGSIVLRAAGVELASVPLTWQRETVLTIVARHTAELQFLSVTGTSPPFETSGGAGRPIAPLPERVFILGGPAGAQEGADLRAIDFVRH